MKTILLLGSTGSIGRQAVDVILRHPAELAISGLSCGRNVPLLREQLKRLEQTGALRNVKALSVLSETDAADLRKDYPALEIYAGEEGLSAFAAETPCDMVLNGLMGMRGLSPTYRAIMAGRDIALANKETLVAGGALVMDAVSKKGVKLLPVDSEHSAIFQCLQGVNREELTGIFLTASGGPFRGWKKEQLAGVTAAQALKHPNWSMGAKITIDSATLMNKGLEIIEACWLFGLSPEQVEVLVHPESIVHSMIRLRDGAVLAQLGVPSMELPIGYALSWPTRFEDSSVAVPDFFRLGSLHFEPADRDAFPCLSLALQAIRQGGGAPVAMNAANEVLVQQFLEGKIGFQDIPAGIEKILSMDLPGGMLSLEEVLALDREIRRKAESC